MHAYQINVLSSVPTDSKRHLRLCLSILDGPGSRSGSQHGSRENSAARGSLASRSLHQPLRNMPFNSMPSMGGSSSSQKGLRADNKSSQSQQHQHQLSSSSSGLNQSNQQSSGAASAVVQSKDVNETELNKVQKIAKTILTSHQNDEFRDTRDLDNAPSLEAVARKDRWAIVREIYNLSAELKGLNESNRVFVGTMCSYWVKNGLITKEDYLRGITEYLEPIEDVQIDVPKIWEWTVETICKYIMVAHPSAHSVTISQLPKFSFISNITNITIVPILQLLHSRIIL